LGLDQPEGTLVGYGVEFALLHASTLGTSLSGTSDCLHTTAGNWSTAAQSPAHQLTRSP